MVAKDQLHAEAVALRRDGWTVPSIAARLGVARSTAYLWVRHVPLDRDSEAARQRRREHSRRMTDARWAAHRASRDAAQEAVQRRVAEQMGALSPRELLIVGAAIYWCEGAKSKPWRRADHVQLINSDAGLLAVFLRFLEICGVDRTVPSYRLSIHESADIEAAQAWWAKELGLPAERFKRPTLKRHNPKTVRYNTGSDYHGCLVINVPRSRELYWQIEGMIEALHAAPDAGEPRG